MLRTLSIGLMTAVVAAGCGNSSSARVDAAGSDAGTDATATDAAPAMSPPPMTGLAVVNSDFSTTSLSILDTTGALLHADCVDSATDANGGSTNTISGDAVLPSQPQLGGEVVIIDRGDVALTFVDPNACKIVRQVAIPGLKTNPHDVVMLTSTKAYVTRYDPNLAAATPSLAGNDVVAIDPSSGAFLNRIVLDAYASIVPGATILARPDRAVLVDGKVIVSLNEIDQGFKTYGEGQLVVLDPVTDTVTGALALTGLVNCAGMAYVDAQKILLVACGGPYAGSTSESGIAVVDVDVSPPVLARVVPSAAFDGRPLSFGWVLALPPTGGGTRAFAVTTDPNDVQPDALFAFDYVAGTTTQVAASGPYTFGTPAGLPGLLLMPNSTRSMPQIDRYDVTGSPSATTTFTSDPVTKLPPREIAAF